MANANAKPDISGSCFFKGHTVKGNYDVQLKIGFTEDTVKQAIQLIAGIGRNLDLLAKVGNNKLKLGTWTVYKVVFDKNLQSTVTLASTIEMANMESIPDLMVEEVEIQFAGKFRE